MSPLPYLQINTSGQVINIPLPPAARGVRRRPSFLSRFTLKAEPVFRASSKLSMTPSWSPSVNKQVSTHVTPQWYVSPDNVKWKCEQVSSGYAVLSM